MKNRFYSNGNSIIILLITILFIIDSIYLLPVGIDTFIGVALIMLFTLINFTNLKLTLSKLSVALIIVFILHLVYTTDRITTVILLISTLLFYETLKKAPVSYKPIVYFFVAFTLVEVLITYQNMFESLMVQHTNREGLYLGFFANSNTNAGYLLNSLYAALLFLNKSKYRTLLLLITLVAIVATGSRNAVLCVILIFCFNTLHRMPRFNKYGFTAFILIISAAFVYLYFFEMQSSIDFTFMGKEANSAGRAYQIAIVIANFPITLLGSGKDVIESYVNFAGDYSIHNFYVNSLYALGILPILGYIYYIYDLYKKIESSMAKSVLLSSNVYFFFEPGVCFYFVFLTMMPILLVILKYNQETHSERNIISVSR